MASPRPSRFTLLALLACAAFAGHALPRAVAADDPSKVVKAATVQAALAAAKRNEPETIEEQIRINEIPAPPFKEEVRAAELKRRFIELGLEDVRIDKVGNVLGVRRGLQPKPHLVVAAHLDTVFPEGTDVRVRREGTKLIAPGIGDDTRGLAAMLSIIRAMNEGKVQTTGTVTFVANVGEEGLGDLRGAKALFNDTLKGTIDMFISIDGIVPTHVTNGGVGSYRYRVAFKGPGGHSYGAFGLVNPIHALGRAVAKIDTIEVPLAPKTTFNVGRIGGGTSVNSIAFEAWMEIDVRSPDVASLEVTRDKILNHIDDAVKEENARWSKGEITVVKDLVGFRPAGSTPGDSEIVKTAQGAINAFGQRATMGSSSTDSNIPMSLGIPAVTIGGGGSGEGAHSLEETFDTTDSYKGPQYAIVLITSLAGLASP